MGSKKEKFQAERWTLKQFASLTAGDETDISIDDWNALSPKAKKAHLKKFNDEKEQIEREEWNDAVQEGQLDADPVPEGKRKPGYQPKKQPSLKSGGLTTGKLTTGRLMAAQPGSGGSEGMKYLYAHDPFSSERGSNQPGSNPPAPKKSKVAKEAPGAKEWRDKLNQLIPPSHAWGDSNAF